MTLMKQGGRTLLHLINVSGHSQTGYYPAVLMHAIQIEIAGKFSSARSIRKPANLPVASQDGYSQVVLPELTDYELVVLQ